MLFSFNEVLYNLVLPPWWEDININLSNELFSQEYTISDYVRKNFGKDTGTKENWQSAFKAYAIFCHKTDEFPLFLAHCARAGEDFELAIKIYTELYHLIPLYGEDEAWYHSYIGYCIGETYQRLGQKHLAYIWYKKTGVYQTHHDSSISYYAKLSLKNLQLIA